MLIRLGLCCTALSACLLFATGSKRNREQDSWLSKIGKIQINETNAGEAWLIINGKPQHKFPSRSFLRASFREFGYKGAEIFLLQINAADSAWFHILEIKDDGSFTLSAMFGNGSDLPTIKSFHNALEIEFGPLDLPRGRVEGQTWRYEARTLNRLK